MLSCDLLWDAPSVRRKQIPTLQDALICANVETLLSLVEQLYARRMPNWESASPQQRRVARKRMSRALEAMRESEVERKDGRPYCVFPEERFVVHASTRADTIERVVQARVARIDGPQPDANVSPSAQLFECRPWSQALAYRVWLEGAQGCHERYMVLANAFWRLTHQGFGAASCSGASHAEQGEGRGTPFLSEKDGRPSPSGMLPRNSCAFVSLSDACGSRGRAFADSTGQLLGVRAAAMGLYVPDALEDSYRERLVARVETLNKMCERDFAERVSSLSQRLDAA